MRRAYVALGVCAAPVQQQGGRREQRSCSGDPSFFFNKLLT